MNIYLVEDERWALAELVELFKAYEPQHRIFAFENGEDALAAASHTSPHLVLTDINMPGMDGLELIARLNLAERPVKGIILSVHDQFAYAQKGMQLGAADYLLKPVKKDVLYKTIDRAIQAIESDERQKAERINWSVVQMLLASSFPENELSAALDRRPWCLALLLLENRASARGWKETSVSSGDIKRPFLDGTFQEQSIHCIDIDSQRKAVLIPAHAGSHAGGIIASLVSLHHELQQTGNRVHLSYVFKREKEPLHKCFAFVNKQLEEHMKLGVSSFIAPGTQAAEADLGGVWDKVRVLQSCLLQGGIVKAKQTVYKIVGELQQKDITMKQLLLFVGDMLYSLTYNLQSAAGADIKSGHWQEDMKIFEQITTYRELSDWLEDRIVSLFCKHEPKELKPKSLAPVLMNWIHNNYQRDICLQQFAAEHHVSLSYLSRLFKSQTGCTFSEYLIRYRIGKAQTLLTEGVDRLADVSSLVGYEDTKHFSQLFKKIVGETPAAYGKRKQAPFS